jgi:hypothetical protein
MFLGNDWTFYLPANEKRELNIVKTPAKVVASRMLHLLLTIVGEDPIHPTLGLMLPLFIPLTSPSVQFFTYNAREEILKWNQEARMGIKALAVEIAPQTVFRNDITINIRYIPETENAVSTLAFGYYAYTGIRQTQDIDEFVKGVILNGEPFPNLSNE